MTNPIDKARQQIESANYRYQMRQSDRVRSLDSALMPTVYEGYDATQGLPQTSNLFNDEVVADGYLLTNSGLEVGQSLEPGFRSFDSTPRIQTSRPSPRNTTEDPQIAVVMELTVFNDEAVKIGRRFFLKIDNKPLIILDDDAPLSSEVSAVIPVNLFQWIIQTQYFDGTEINANLINRVYYSNRGLVTNFEGISENISGYPVDYFQFVYPPNDLGDYVLRGQPQNRNNVPDEFYYPVIYLTTKDATQEIYDPTLEELIAPYKLKWTTPTWNGLFKRPDNWINLFRGIDIGVSINPTSLQEISRGNFIRISLADIQAMNVPTNQDVYTGVGGDLLGTFEELTSGAASTITPRLNTQITINDPSGTFARYLFTIRHVKAILG